MFGQKYVILLHIKYYSTQFVPFSCMKLLSYKYRKLVFAGCHIDLYYQHASLMITLQMTMIDEGGGCWATRTIMKTIRPIPII